MANLSQIFQVTSDDADTAGQQPGFFLGYQNGKPRRMSVAWLRSLLGAATSLVTGLVPVPPAAQANAQNFLGGDLAYHPVPNGTQNNFAATANPTAANDSSQGYAVGSFWLNTNTRTLWECVSATAGAAHWIQPSVTAMHPGYQVGSYYPLVPPGAAITGGSTPGGQSNNIFLYPFFVGRRLTISQLGLNITALASGGYYGLAIYANNEGLPGKPLCTVASASTSGMQTVTGTTQLEPGWYWAAFVPDATTGASGSAFRAYSFAATNSALTAMVGSTLSGMGGWLATTSQVVAWVYATAQSGVSFASNSFAFPDLTGIAPSGFCNTTALVPVLGMKVASVP